MMMMTTMTTTTMMMMMSVCTQRFNAFRGPLLNTKGTRTFNAAVFFLEPEGSFLPRAKNYRDPLR